MGRVVVPNLPKSWFRRLGCILFGAGMWVCLAWWHARRVIDDGSADGLVIKLVFLSAGDGYIVLPSWLGGLRCLFLPASPPRLCVEGSGSDVVFVGGWVGWCVCSGSSC